MLYLNCSFHNDSFLDMNASGFGIGSRRVLIFYKRLQNSHFEHTLNTITVYYRKCPKGRENKQIARPVPGRKEEEKMELLNKHLKGFNRQYVAFVLRDCYKWLKYYTSEACICEEYGKSSGIIDMGFVTGTITKQESERYRKAFWNLYAIKRGYKCSDTTTEKQN